MSASTKQQALRLINEYPQERLLLRAACDEARRCAPGDFAGSWVLTRLSEIIGQSDPVAAGSRSWRPGLRRLTAYGLIQKTEVTRGGRRAYYRMDELDAVEEALAETETVDGRDGSD